MSFLVLWVWAAGMFNSWGGDLAANIYNLYLSSKLIDSPAVMKAEKKNQQSLEPSQKDSETKG